MTIDKALHRIFVSLALASAGVSILGWTPDEALAASASSEISAIVLQSSSVGVVNVLDVTPTPTPTTTPAPAIPAVSSSRDVGVSISAGAAPSAPRSSSSARSSGAAAPVVSPSAGSSPAVISISGQPNQVISISLPSESIVVANGAQVAVTGFTHDAGITPTIDASGSGTFNVTAAVAEAAAESGTTSGDAAGAAAGTGGQVPYEKLVVATASPRFDIVISYN